MVHIGTLPYYRLYQFNTVNPILRIAACTSQPNKFDNVLRLMVRWRARKLAELHFISIAVGPFLITFLSHCRYSPLDAEKFPS